MEEVDYVIGNSHKFSSLLGVIRRGEVQSEPKVLISDIFKEKKRKFDTPDIRFFPTGQGRSSRYRTGATTPALSA